MGELSKACKRGEGERRNLYVYNLEHRAHISPPSSSWTSDVWIVSSLPTRESFCLFGALVVWVSFCTIRFDVFFSFFSFLPFVVSGDLIANFGFRKIQARLTRISTKVTRPMRAWNILPECPTSPANCFSTFAHVHTFVTWIVHFFFNGAISHEPKGLLLVY